MSQLDLGGCTLYVTDEPARAAAPGAPFVLVHGLARSGWFWRDWVEPLRARHRVIRIDLRGCGRSPVPAQGSDFGFTDLVADVRQVMDKLALPAVNYVGESTGGLVGTVIAATSPGSVATLSLVSTPTRPADGDPRTKAPGAATPEQSLRELGLEQWWLRSRAMTGDLFNDRRDAEYAAEFARTPVSVAVAMWKAMHEPDVDLARWAGGVRARTLILSPGRSTSLSAAGQRQLQEMIPGAVLQTYPDWTHGMYFLHPAELAADVLRFVDGDPGQR